MNEWQSIETAPKDQPLWESGEPANLQAAAEDADEWLALIERLHALGRWHFSDPASLPKLRACRSSLRHFLGSSQDQGLL